LASAGVRTVTLERGRIVADTKKEVAAPDTETPPADAAKIQELLTREKVQETQRNIAGAKVKITSIGAL